MEIFRRLVTENPAFYEPDLARSLSNLSNRLSQAGRRGEALSASEQAVEIRRRLAADNPAFYEPYLARSLTILGVRLAEAGDPSTALQVTGEAVNLYRSLVATMPSLLPGGHEVLGLQVVLLESLGRSEDADAVRNWLRAHPLPPILISGICS
ncbi:tetratricopeptide repeat protein [Streptomyces sp. SID4917]|nr:tetratricopeptide repeat protein [Streptomyces sp. SID4917]